MEPNSVSTEPSDLHAAAPERAGDLTALAWVHDELRRSLDTAHKSLRRLLRDLELRAASAQLADGGMPPAVQQARTLVHQGVGVLQMIGLPAAARCLSASELVLQRLGGTPAAFTPEVVGKLERVSFALLDYLQRMLAGQPVSALALFPPYRAALELARAERIHPADLWDAPAASADESMALPVTALPVDARVRGALEAALLDAMRGRVDAQARTSRLYAGLAAGADAAHAPLWARASAVFEAQAAGLLKPDVYSQRLGSRLLAQVRAAERGHSEVPARLLQDLSFFCARARLPARAALAPQLARVRAVLALPDLGDLNYDESPLGRFDPALVPQARRRVGAFKDIWAVAASGDAGVLPACAEQVALVAESVRQLYPGGERLGQALAEAVQGCAVALRAPGPELAMEVATTLLCLDASLDELDLDQPELARRIGRLAERLEQLKAGRDPEPIEPWMESLYREVSDRQTMGSVVQELRAALAEVEQQLDRFHRHPGERELLLPVPAQLGTMRGVLSVLGLPPAAQAVQRMRADVDEILAGSEDGEATTARLADNLGVMSFLIDLLGVQPQLAKSLFRFDPETGRFTAVMGRSVAAPEAAADARLRERVQNLAETVARPDVSHDALSRELESLAQHAEAADEAGVAQAAARARDALAQADDPAQREAARADAAQAFSAMAGAAQSAPLPLPEVNESDDMREVFFEEAAEVIAQARDALAHLDRDPRDLEAMTTIRRAFHTLKGSARMVQLREFGETAWACEQLFNTRLAQADAEVDRELRHFTVDALDALQAWVDALVQDGEAAGHSGLALSARAASLRDPAAAAPAVDLPEPVAEPTQAQAQAQAQVPVPVPVQAPEPATAEALLPFPELPHEALPPAAVEAASRLDFPSLDGAVAEPPHAPTVPGALPEPAGLDFAFDLDLDLDLPGEAPPATAVPAEAVARAADLPRPVEAEPQPPALQADVDSDESLLSGDWAPTTTDLPPDLRDDAAAPATVDFELDLLLDLSEFPAAPAEPVVSAEPPVAEPVVPTEPGALAPELADDDAERYKIVGPLRVPIALFNIYLNEADEQSRRLCTDLAEWQLEQDQPVSDTAVALAHSLAGNSATVGFRDLSALARRLEHALERSHARGHGHPDEALLFLDVAEEIRRLLHQFAAGFLREISPELDARLSLHEHRDAAQVSQLGGDIADAEPAPATPLPRDDTALGALRFSPLRAAPAVAAEAPAEVVRASPADWAPLPVHADDLDAVDALDAELFEIFTEEAQELIPALAQQVRAWEQDPAELGQGVAAMRSLHTLKGGARLSGAMRLGEMAHRLETTVERLTARGVPDVAAVTDLHGGVDALAEELRRLLAGPAELPVSAAAPEPALAEDAPAPPVESDAPAPLAPPPVADPQAPQWDEHQARIDWQRFQAQPQARAVFAAAAASEPVSGGLVRVRAQLLDRLVSHAGEVGSARGRIETEVGLMRSQLRELTDNLERLRRQLRDLELQAETQMSSRMEAARQSQQVFDPLEMDRFTRVQELTRMLAESVSDVGTVQRGIQQALQASEDQLAAQSRLTRDLQDDLLRARMVEFDTVADRLYRVVRQAAKESGKQVRLNITGGTVEVDRSVLDRMAPAFEHLLRNAVVHGIEPPALREATGKSATGTIDIGLRQTGNEVRVEVRDDGAGLNLVRIADRARAAGLLSDADRPTEADLAGLIFKPGFTTVDEVTELAGRGIGMEVVRSEVTAMGGRIETSTAVGQGTAFQLVLPLTTAVTQVVALDCDGLRVAVPSTLVEQVRRVPAAEVQAAYASGALNHGDRELPFFWMGGLLQHGVRGTLEGRTAHVLIVRSASQRVAVHVSSVLGNQEVVVKNLGPQLARLPGLAGMSLLVSGDPVLIYNPVALAAVYGEEAHRRLAAVGEAPLPQAADAPPAELPALLQPQPPLVLVVDDSLTVRRVTQRLLQREGFRVALARDGLEALEQLAAERPALMLSDIEMPRMDGFDLVRNVRAEPRWQDLPVIMITSRIAQKHRDHAVELGVQHYLGKPYDEEALMALVRQYTEAAAATAG